MLKPMIENEVDSNRYLKYQLTAVAPKATFMSEDMGLPNANGKYYRYLKCVPFVNGVPLSNQMMIIEVLSGKRIR
jgi:hypothetical protein